MFLLKVFGIYLNDNVFEVPGTSSNDVFFSELQIVIK